MAKSKASEQFKQEILSQFPANTPLTKQLVGVNFCFDMALYEQFHPNTPEVEAKIQWIKEMGTILAHEMIVKNLHFAALAATARQVIPILPDCSLLNTVKQLFIDFIARKPCDADLLVKTSIEIFNYQLIYTRRLQQYMTIRNATLGRTEKTKKSKSKLLKELHPIFLHIRAEEQKQPELKGRQSPFAVTFANEIRSVLERHDCWRPKNYEVDGETFAETPGEMRQRLYKSTYKTYQTWKTENATVIEELQSFAKALVKHVWIPINSEREILQESLPYAPELTDKELLSLRDEILGLLEALDNQH